MNNQIITLDVRDDIRNGREPFSKIMAAAAKVTPGEKLRILAPFEPVPLFRVLENQGFSHTAKPAANGDWEALFTRIDRGETKDNQPMPSERAIPEGAAVEIDARGLEPPQPMVKVLEALTSLPPGACLDARTDRRPLHLYTHLENRGFTAETKELSDGSFLTHISRR